MAKPYKWHIESARVVERVSDGLRFNYDDGDADFKAWAAAGGVPDLATYLPSLPQP